MLVFFLYKQLLFMTFDPEVAPIYGVPSGLTETVFALMLAGTIIASMQVMGVTLIAAAIVIPAIVARLLTDSFSTMLWLATLVGAACGLAGIYLSYFLDVASGATIVLVAAALFVAVYSVVSLRQRLSGRAARQAAAASRARSIAGLFDDEAGNRQAVGPDSARLLHGCPFDSRQQGARAHRARARTGVLSMEVGLVRVHQPEQLARDDAQRLRRRLADRTVRPQHDHVVAITWSS